MACRIEIVKYVADQLEGAGNIVYKKMFGEYGLYCDRKIFAVICDDRLFVKITEKGKELVPALSEAPPYKGAKNYLLVEDVDDWKLLTKLVKVTCEQLPEPKPKKRTNKRKI